MRYVEIGGVRLSAVGLGTWQFGSREWGYGDDYAEREAVAIVHRALDLGVNLIDTAEIYAFGRSERIVGRALHERRDEAFVATKLFPVAPFSPVVQRRARGSAGRLGVDTIDLYQVHWPNPVVPVRAVMSAFGELQTAGLVDHVGVSNFSLEQWQEAEQALGGRVLTNQVSYSLAACGPDRELIPWALANQRVVIAYSPLAQGLLSGRYDASRRPGGVRSGNALFLPENLDRAQPLLEALREIALSHTATPAQVALAWTIRHPNVVAIPGASSIAQLEANAAAAELVLSEDDVARLTAASDAFHPKTGPAAIPDLVRARFSR